MKRAANIWQEFLRVSLWIVSIGLMLASSGIDGFYLTKLMPPGWGWLGLVLNTMADISAEVIMYWYGRLRQAGRKGLGWILVVQVVLTGYAWLFGWRQLAPIVSEIEPRFGELLAAIMAAFIPIALVGIGYVQALLAGKVVVAKSAPTEVKAEPIGEPEHQLAPIVDEPLAGEALRDAILAAMSTNEPPTYQELAAQFNSSPSTVGYHVRALRKEGRLNGHSNQ